MTLLEMLKREQPMAASYSWLRNDCGMPATATIIKSVPDIIAALEAAEELVQTAGHDSGCRWRGGHDCSCGLDEALDKYRKAMGHD